jgi:hypothetical protein
MSQIRLDSLTESLNDLGKPFMDTGRDAWLAGLGAFSLVRRESGKVADQGVKVFDKLVSEGKKFQRKTSKTVRKEAYEATTQVAEAASKAASTLKQGPMTFHLLPRNEEWVVRSEGSDENFSLHDTKESAMEAARGIARAHEPSRLVAHRADGTIQTSYTYG